MGNPIAKRRGSHKSRNLLWNRKDECDDDGGGRQH